MPFHSCQQCGAVSHGEFPAEVCIHFPGPENLSKPAVFVFPRLWVCMNCGTAQFRVARAELQRLAQEDFGEQSFRPAV